MLSNSPVGIKDDSSPAGAPEEEIEITPEMIEKGTAIESWLGLFEQFFRFDKWNACRVQAAAICDSRLK